MNKDRYVIKGYWIYNPNNNDGDNVLPSVASEPVKTISEAFIMADLVMTESNVNVVKVFDIVNFKQIHKIIDSNKHMI